MTAPLPGPLAADASLHLLADHLADALTAGELEPSLLHVADVDGHGFDLGTRPLDGAHPTQLLIGFDAPAAWHALGLATGGWAYRVEQRSRRDRARVRVHLVTLVSRSGELVHRTRSDDSSLSETLDGELPGGEQIDLLRLALGLPTDPAPCDASVYWTILWLFALLQRTPPPTDLADAAAAHPAMRLLDADGTFGSHEVVDVLAGFHRVCTWRRLQLLAGEGSWPVADLAPRHVPWFDEGAFARFLLNRCPSLRELRQRLADALAGDVLGEVEAVLDVLGVPEAAWPDHAAPPRPAA